MTNVNNAIELGLNEDEFNQIIKYLGRIPNITELGIFSAMWSEHCSYKSSRKWLKKLPTKEEWVIQGPGENAGIIDIGNGLAAVFKMESHNHPSFIEPYQGAATGVGGIMRDVFTMGARPVANMNCLRFGSPNHHKTKHLLSGVVSGIGGYGNCMGVPTIGGECTFDKGYNGNILVNAMTVGDETAATLGIKVAQFRLQVFFVCALITGVMVAFSGMIGFVGLMIPHLVRMMVGGDYVRVIPYSALLGAIFLLWADITARTIMAPEDMPIGIVTGFVGGIFFVWLLGRR